MLYSQVDTETSIIYYFIVKTSLLLKIPIHIHKVFKGASRTRIQRRHEMKHEAFRAMQARPKWFRQGLAFAAFAAVLAGGSSALAQMTIESACMQDIAGFGLNCTANDVQISGVARNPDGTPQLDILDDGCAYPGDTVTFEATFELVVTAKERHDVGIYFVRDGDPNDDGAVSGQCSIVTLPYQPDPPWLDLDETNDPVPGTNTASGIQDACGDIDKPAHSPMYFTVTLSAACVDDDGDGYLNLPNCTSWRQSGANELCLSPVDAFPGAPSKCRCDMGFNVPIDVPPAVLAVTKTANPVAMNEPGGNVTFTVSVTNLGIDPANPVTLSSLQDDIYGDITVSGQAGIVSTTCSVPVLIPSDDQNPGGIDTYTCQFTAAVLGNAGDEMTDTVTASGVDARGNVLQGEDGATVTILDVLPQIFVLKTAEPTEVLEPGGTVTFTFVVSNASAASSDPVTIASLMDDIHGNLNGQGSCSIPQTIVPGESYSCSLTTVIAGNAGEAETNVVTASGADDEGNPVSHTDSETVVINDVPSSIRMTKTANPSSLDEPGGDVRFTFTVDNLSAVDTVTIDTLTDSIYGDLHGQGDCLIPQTILPGGSYTCSFETYVEGNGNMSETNIATASGEDDDGEPVQGTANATVNINNVRPAADLTKTATAAVVTYRVQISNTSTAEALSLDSLSDDTFGDITQIQGSVQSSTCSVPQTLAPAGETGDTYTCSFEARIESSPHTNRVTGVVTDDDGSAPIEPSDEATVSFQ